MFPYISSSGNGSVVLDPEFQRASEMKDERVDLIIEMIQKKYDWSKHVWAYQETVQPVESSSEEDGSGEEEAGETSENEMEAGIETTPVSAVRKRKSKFQDRGAESRKKRLLSERSNEKYRDLEEEMKTYIHSMFKSSFTALRFEVREIIEDRFAKLEEKVISSLTQGGAPAYSQSRGAPDSSQSRGADPAYTHSHAADPPSTEAPTSVPTRARAPTLASTHTSAHVPTTSRSQASGPSRSRGPAPSPTGGPANAAKTRSQSKVNKK